MGLHALSSALRGLRPNGFLGWLGRWLTMCLLIVFAALIIGLSLPWLAKKYHSL